MAAMDPDERLRRHNLLLHLSGTHLLCSFVPLAFLFAVSSPLLSVVHHAASRDKTLLSVSCTRNTTVCRWQCTITQLLP